MYFTRPHCVIWLTFTTLHAVISQKVDLFIIPNMRSSKSNKALKSSILWDIMPYNQLIQQTTRSYIPEDRNVHNHCCENLNSYNHSPISHLFTMVHFWTTEWLPGKTCIYCILFISPPSLHIGDKNNILRRCHTIFGTFRTQDNPNLKVVRHAVHKITSRDNFAFTRSLVIF
jgi:hypothetical protein